MSIIHEALKRAEQEREVRRARWPIYRGGRPAHRPWRWGVTTGLVVGVTLAAGVGLWGWLPIPLSSARLGEVTGITQSAPAPVAAIVPETNRQAIPTHPRPRPVPLEAPLRFKSDELSGTVASVPLTPDLQALAAATFKRAREAESTGQWSQAERDYRQALVQNPALAEAHNNLGNLYIRQQQMSAAIGEFRAAMALNPNYAMVRNNLGSAYILMGEEELAIQEFIAALRLDGAYVSPYYNLASLYGRRADVGQAAAFLTKALALDATVISWVQEDPDFDKIRGAPEFQRLRAQALVRR
jgi:tetratricopeptide (TPR) repeat protein